MNQSDEKKDNIQRVIETALDMFMENGIAATSMNQIAQKVNLSQMSLYRYFGNTIDHNRGKATNREFIARMSNVVRDQMKRQ